MISPKLNMGKMVPRQPATMETDCQIPSAITRKTNAANKFYKKEKIVKLIILLDFKLAFIPLI